MDLNNMKQSLNKLQITIITLATLTIIGIIWFLTNKSQTTTPPTSLPTPQIESPLKNPDQLLDIIWQISNPSLPKQTPLYQVSTPLISSSSARLIAQNLNFTSQDIIFDQNSQLVYKNKTRTLSANFDQHQLTYNDPAPNLPDQNFPDQQTIQTVLLNQLNRILNSPPDLTVYQPSQPITASYQSQDTSQTQVISFTQSPNQTPLLSNSVQNTPLTVIFDSNLNIRHLEILGGYQSLNQTTTLPLLTFTQIKDQAPQNAQRLPSSALIKNEQKLTAASQLNLTVNQLNLVYLFDPQTPTILHPVFLLSGPLSASDLTLPSTNFILPASK